ncbi:MAG: hypothetical protein M5R40_18040 [Anaerolineae bacterium]|nr:hypothetical protein [Anaerolineae bacterium]
MTVIKDDFISAVESPGQTTYDMTIGNVSNAAAMPLDGAAPELVDTLPSRAFLRQLPGSRAAGRHVRGEIRPALALSSSSLRRRAAASSPTCPPAAAAPCA